MSDLKPGRAYHLSLPVVQPLGMRDGALECRPPVIITARPLSYKALQLEYGNFHGVVPPILRLFWFVGWQFSGGNEQLLILRFCATIEEKLFFFFF